MRRHPSQLHAVRTLAACLPALLLAGCAGRYQPDEPVPGTDSPRLTVRVVNQCSDIVQVYFVAEAGWRVRVGTVAPLEAGLFTTRLVADQPGQFVTRRIAAAEQPTTLAGNADPLMIGSRVVHLTVGPSPEFDRWMLR